ncbi:hypothetical protein J3F84DRAFT_304142 [Trichoderma pleuroticola]
MGSNQGHGSSNEQQIEHQQDPSDLDRDERHGPEETAVWGRPGFALGLLSATTVARRRKRGDRLCSRLGRGRAAGSNQQWTSSNRGWLIRQTDETSQVETSQSRRGEASRSACSARFGWPRVFCFADEGARRDVMDHGTGDEKRARRLDPARQSERAIHLDEPGPQAATAWSRHKVQLPRFGGRPSAVIRSIGAKDQLNGVVFGSFGRVPSSVGGWRWQRKKKIMLGRASLGCRPRAVKRHVPFLDRQKTSGGRGNGGRQWNGRLPILMLMANANRMLMPNDGQVDGQEEVSAANRNVLGYGMYKGQGWIERGS